MSNGADFTKMVPGFDFLQEQMKTAAAGLPNMSQWIAPTLSLEEIEKRIGELRTVQFWLEQNAKLLAATVQSLEVQRMTLSTLKSMNLPLADVREALKIPVPGVNPPAGAALGAGAAPGASAPAGAAKPAADPMQWWGALTQQFTEIAAQALRESTAEATRNLAAAAAAGRPAESSATPAPAKAGAAATKPAAAGGADAPAAGSARRRKS